MRGWVLVDNLAAAPPGHAQRGAALGLRPMTPSRIAKITGTETRADNRKGSANHHPVRWTQISCHQVRNAFARARRQLAAAMGWRCGRKWP